MMVRKHIVAIFPHFLPRIGGAEHHLYQLAQHLGDRGHQVSILVPRHGNAPRVMSCGSTTVFRFGADERRESYISAFEQIVEWVKSEGMPADSQLYIALCAGPIERSFALSRVMAWARGRGVPYTLRITSSGKLEGIIREAPFLRSDLLMANQIVALNSGIVRELEHLGVSDRRIMLIPNAVDSSRFVWSPGLSRLHSDWDTLSVIFPCRFVAKKKVLLAVDVWRKLMATTSGQREMRLLLLGDDFQESTRGSVFESVRNLIDGPGTESIVLHRAVPHSQMPRKMLESNIFLMLSVREGMSNALLEGMSSGHIVIAPDTYASREVIRSGENGFLFDENDPYRAIDCFQELLESTGERLDAVRSRAIQTVSRSHSWHQIADMYADMFRLL